MRRVLVTGASGFVGRDLIAVFRRRGIVVRAAYRRFTDHGPLGSESVAVGDLGPNTDWSDALQGVDAVVHLAGAAHAHVQNFQHVIVEATEALAGQAAQSGVTRFLYMSSIKACGARSRDAPLHEAMRPTPSDPYGAAKLSAERAVLAKPEINPVVLRPPLVHGAAARHNFAALLRLADSPLPLPFAGFSNKRSLISLSSLIDAAASVLASPGGLAGIYHVADRPALSVQQIVSALRRGLGRNPSLFHIPGVAHLAPAALRESLEVDDTLFRNTFGYGASQNIDAVGALESAAAAWKAQR